MYLIKMFRAGLIEPKWEMSLLQFSPQLTIDLEENWHAVLSLFAILGFFILLFGLSGVTDINNENSKITGVWKLINCLLFGIIEVEPDSFSVFHPPSVFYSSSFALMRVGFIYAQNELSCRDSSIFFILLYDFQKSIALGCFLFRQLFIFNKITC